MLLKHQGQGRESESLRASSPPATGQVHQMQWEIHGKKSETPSKLPSQVGDRSFCSLLQAFQPSYKEHTLAVCKKVIVTGKNRTKEDLGTRLPPEAKLDVVLPPPHNSCPTHDPLHVFVSLLLPFVSSTWHFLLLFST